MIKILTIIVINAILIQNVISDCIMYGECGPTPKENGVYNCKYSGKSKKLPQHILKKFKDVCPHLYNGNETFTCCDADQVARLIDGISVPKQLMSRCPSCFLNFRTLVCDFSCSPKQHEFVHISSEENFNRFQYEKNKKAEENSQNDDEYDDTSYITAAVTTAAE